MATRDYARPQRPKPAPQRRQPARKQASGKRSGGGNAALGLPLWAWMVVSFSLLVFGAALYYISRPVVPMDLVPSSEGKAGKTAAKTIEIPPKEPARFGFYEMLPSYEVVVPDDVLNPPKPKPGSAANNLPPRPAAATVATPAATARAAEQTPVTAATTATPVASTDKPVVAVAIKPSTPAASKPAPEPDAEAALAAALAREAPLPTAQLARGEQFLIQVAAFRTRADAEQRVAALTLVGLAAKVEQVTIDNKDTWYRVRLGPYGSAATAANAQQTLKTQGFNGVVMKVKG